jgi:AraC-like DNA-binding protein/ligand-binding sensor protein
MADVSHIPLTPSNIAPPEDQPATPSILEKLMRLIEEPGQLAINFEDLSGVSYDVPDLRLPFAYHLHGCRFCQVAKASRTSHLDCIRNKMASNRTAMRRQAGFVGMCHLGLTDIVEPLIYRGRVLGVFYFGSVVVHGTEDTARQRILKYCTRRRVDASPLLHELSRAPVVERTSLARHRERLVLAVEFAVRVLDANSLPLDRYRTEMSAHLLQARKDIPALIQAAMRFVHRQYSTQIQITEVAGYLKCHPDYLSRLFKKSVGCGFGEYVMRVRIDRARNLIETGKYSMGEVAWNTGFQDQSHFGRVFKRLVGMTPGEFQSHPPTAETSPQVRFADLAEDHPSPR